MKNDWYLKTVLTVIAIALTVLILQNAQLIPTAQAATISHDEPMPVKIMDWNGAEELNVSIKSWEVEDKINVNIDEVGGYFVTNGVLKVENQ
ncbi:MAG: hypothetical protein IIA45_10110 [Bacteroidetes bacterium]|nr:hypothetical protein [Bacteroidota bacterium]